MATSEAIAEAKQKLQRAIHEYYGTVGDDIFITEWVLIVHKASAELQLEGKSAVGYVVPDDQYFHRTVGLIDVAHETAKR